MINNEPRFELWEWSEDDLDPETVLELENFALSMSHFYSQFLAFHIIFLVLIILGIGIISGLLILIGEIVVHRVMK